MQHQCRKIELMQPLWEAELRVDFPYVELRVSLKCVNVLHNGGSTLTERMMIEKQYSIYELSLANTHMNLFAYSPFLTTRLLTNRIFSSRTGLGVAPAYSVNEENNRIVR